MDVFFFFISKCNTQFGEIPDRCLIGDKVGLIKNCAYLLSHGIWQSYMYALDVSIGKQNVLGIRNSPEKPLMVGIIFCYKFAVDVKIEKRVILFLFRTLFIFEVPQDLVV